MTFSRVVTRFAPSPTGKLHIGGARTALFNWLFARANNGKFLLRIEDTDRERSSEEATAQILASLKWLNLDWDDAPISQFSRQALHQKKALELLQSGEAYKCFATPDEISEIRAELKAKGNTTLFVSPWRDVPEEQHPDLPYTIRLKTPATGKSIITDRVFGEISIDNETIDDLIILRSDGSPTYNFAVVVDDHDMEVSHIIRGDDHIANTFKQKLIYEAFDWHLPVFAHVPLILNEQGKKLSKREGSTGTELYRKEGYLSEVVFNFLARLGWSHGTDEIFSAAEAIKRFKLEDLRKSPSRLDGGILKHLSGQYISKLELEELYQHLLDFLKQNNFGKIPENKEEIVKKALPLIQARSKTLQEVWEGLEFVLYETVRYDEKSHKILESTPKMQLEAFLNGLADLYWERDILEDYAKVFGTQLELGLGKVLQPVRAALVGKTVSPSVFDVMIVLGKEESQNRLVLATKLEK
ncbi:MAG: glutamate--tRNA ligase [Rhodobacteraceae bacterium]|nr:glutamate--tRNA ligase [Paracoccaceae bacterium]MCY4249952.1 glutamate--tRNA ligase [Paracoccaceae bacterium]